VDESRASVFVVRGYIEAGRIHRWHEIKGPPELLEVINPAPGPLSVATFVVEVPLVGAPAKKRLRVRFDYPPNWPELKLGQPYQYLAAIISDGASYELEGVAPVARTIENGWAIPVTLDARLSHLLPLHLFPCSMYDVKPERLRFQEPRPRERLPEGMEAEATVDEWEDEGFTLEKGYAYANEGVRLEHVLAAYDGKSAATVSGECH